MELGVSPNEQTRLQKLFGVSGQAVRKWAEGWPPHDGTYAGGGQNLGVRRAWLQDGEEPMRPLAVGSADETGLYQKGRQEMGLSGDEARLLAVYRTLTPELRNALKTVITSLVKSTR